MSIPRLGQHQTRFPENHREVAICEQISEGSRGSQRGNQAGKGPAVVKASDAPGPATRPLTPHWTAHVGLHSQQGNWVLEGLPHMKTH